MNASADSVESELIDFSGITLAALRLQDPGVYARSLSRLLEQIERPRINFNDGGPPGRAD
jgi:hypothetical protein